MCGIAGVVVPRGVVVDSSRLEAIIDAIAHRGPDGAGIWISANACVGLGHRRLSVIDPSPTGAQPMKSASGRYVLTFNGEIYNFLALRRELEKLGAGFRGHSDTEVILAAFEAWGVQPSLPRLRGMFALGIWDAKERVLTLARDRIGIKPLYYGNGPRGFCFASELKPLVIWQGELPKVSSAGLTEFLRLGYVPSPLSIFDGIWKMPPGHFAVFRHGALESSKPYWRLDEVIEAGRREAIVDEVEALRVLEAGLTASVASHMVSDVPLGAFLSGGVDSSLVVSLMQRLSSQPVRTFSIGFHEKGYNEAEHAAAVARHLGTAHTELYVTDQDARGVIPLLPDIYDEPFADQSQIPTFLVSRLAREQVTVALSGDGGDELFGGYNRYVFVARFWQRLRTLPLPLRRGVSRGLRTLSPLGWDRMLERVGPLLPARLNPAMPGQKMHKIASILPAQSLLELHARLVAQWGNPLVVLTPDWQCKDLLWQSQLIEIDGLSAAEQQMFWDTQSYLVDDILTKLDRASMRVGLEARVPLLDHEMVAQAWRVPISMKFKGGTGKWLLRQLLYRYVPQALVDRPKMGFSVPVDAWLRGALRSWAEAYLAPNRLRSEGFFDVRTVRQTWDAHLAGSVNCSGPLWTVLMFQVWLERARKWV